MKGKNVLVLFLTAFVAMFSWVGNPEEKKTDLIHWLKF